MIGWGVLCPPHPVRFPVSLLLVGISNRHPLTASRHHLLRFINKKVAWWPLHHSN